MVVEIKFLKSEIKEMETHMEDDDQCQIWKRKMTYLNHTKADLWRRNRSLWFRSKWKRLICSPLPFSNMYSVHVLLLHFFPISTPAVSQLKFRIVKSLSLLWWFFEASLLKAHTDLISPWLCTIRPINCFSYVLMISSNS